MVMSVVRVLEWKIIDKPNLAVKICRTLLARKIRNKISNYPVRRSNKKKLKKETTTTLSFTYAWIDKGKC